MKYNNDISLEAYYLDIMLPGILLKQKSNIFNKYLLKEAANPIRFVSSSLYVLKKGSNKGLSSIVKGFDLIRQSSFRNNEKSYMPKISSNFKNTFFTIHQTSNDLRGLEAYFNLIKAYTSRVASNRLSITTSYTNLSKHSQCTLKFIDIPSLSNFLRSGYDFFGWTYPLRVVIQFNKGTNYATKALCKLINLILKA